MLLAIDTSAGTSVALVDADGVARAERHEAGTRRHAELIGPFLHDVLAEADVVPAALAGVVVGVGPGPFTGLRVGIAAARVFAAARELPLHPLVSHDAVAFGRDRPVLVVTDARRREVAWSVYDPGVLRRSGPALARPDELDTVVDGYDSLERVDAAGIDAAALARAARLALAEGRPQLPLEAIYLRTPDVTVAS